MRSCPLQVLPADLQCPDSTTGPFTQHLLLLPYILISKTFATSLEMLLDKNLPSNANSRMELPWSEPPG